MTVVPIRREADLFAARARVRQEAATLGFDPREAEELALVATELGSNVLKYGGGGTLEIAAAEHTDGRRGLRLVARDEAPPFDLARALPDGHDHAGAIDPARLFGRRGIGVGLGAVARLMDSLVLEPTPPGKQLVATRYKRSRRRSG